MQRTSEPRQVTANQRQANQQVGSPSTKSSSQKRRPELGHGQDQNNCSNRRRRTASTSPAVSSAGHTQVAVFSESASVPAPAESRNVGHEASSPQNSEQPSSLASSCDRVRSGLASSGLGSGKKLTDYKKLTAETKTVEGQLAFNSQLPFPQRGMKTPRLHSVEPAQPELRQSQQAISQQAVSQQAVSQQAVSQKSALAQKPSPGQVAIHVSSPELEAVVSGTSTAPFISTRKRSAPRTVSQAVSQAPTAAPAMRTNIMRTKPSSQRQVRSTVLSAAHSAQRAALRDERIGAALNGPIDYRTAEARLHMAIATESLPPQVEKQKITKQKVIQQKASQKASIKLQPSEMLQVDGATEGDRQASQATQQTRRIERLAVVRVQARTRRSLRTSGLVSALKTESLGQGQDHPQSTPSADNKTCQDANRNDALSHPANAGQPSECAGSSDPSPTNPLQLLGVALVFTCFLAAAVLL